MRKLLLFSFALAACSGGETAQSDSAAQAAAPAAPATLTAADVAGTWNGESMAEGSDSVTNRWTVSRVDDAQGKIVFQGAADSVLFSTTYDADSMISTSQPYTDPTTKTRVVFKSVGRMNNGALSGTSTIMLADKPDSVVARSRWRATKAP